MGLMALEQAEAAETPGWPEKVFCMKDGTTSHAPFGDTTVFLDGHTGQLKSMVAGTLLLKPGMEPHPPHQHPEEEFMLVTEGHGEILVGGKTYQVSPGSVMYSESNKLHGVKNTKSSAVALLLFQVERLTAASS